MVVFYGRHLGPESHFGDLVSGQMRACVYNAASQTLWVYGLGGWVGDPDGGAAPTGRYAVYDTDAAKNPTARVGYSNSFSASTAYASASGGANQEATIAVADNGPTNGACILYAGRRYAIAFLPTGSAARHSMKPAADVVADNEQFYSRSGLSQPPPAPFGSYAASVEGHASLWALADANVAPDTPTTGLAPSGTVNQTAPTFTANFRDQNAGHSGGTDRGDRLNQYKVQVRRVSDGVIFWDATYTALAAEQTADAMSRAYGGTTLVRGTAYEWRTMQSDYVSAWSGWSAWTAFTPANLGFVTLEDDPTGKILDDSPDVEGKWTHQASDDMTVAQVRILSAGGTVLQTGAEYNIADVASSAAPGTLFTIPWASSGLTTLSWGTSYQYQIRGKDEAALWSDWSAARAFSTDAYPSTPSGLAPSGSQITSSLPILAFSATDPDDTPSPGNLHGYVRPVGAYTIDNPFLNTDGTHWGAAQTDALVTATAGRATDQAHEGAGSLAVEITANTGAAGVRAWSVNDTFVPVTTGQPVQAHGWVRTNTANLCPRFAVFWYDESFAFVSSSQQAVYTPTANSWGSAELTYEVTPPVVGWAKVVCVAEDRVGATTGKTWFDEVGLDGYREATYNAATARFEYQTTTLDYPAFDTYQWLAWGWDETLQGGNSTTATFVYAEGPVITITAPTEAQALASSSISVAWTVASGGPQAKYRVRLYDDNGTTPIYDTGLVTGTATTHVIPSGYVLNETEYDLSVTVENSTPLQGTSTIRNFSIDYPDPDPVPNVQIVATAYATDPWETAVLISWDQTEYATPEWQEYVVTRRANGGPDEEEIILARITSPSQTAFVDQAPASGFAYTYGLTQVIIEGLDTLSSVAVEGEVTIGLGGVVLSDAADGGTYRTVLRNATAREHARHVQEAVYLPVGGANGAIKPLTIRSAVRYWEIDVTAALITDDWATSAQRRDEAEALDARHSVVCYRDDEGRKLFMKIVDLRIADEVPDWFTARMRLREEQHSEGVS